MTARYPLTAQHLILHNKAQLSAFNPLFQLHITSLQLAMDLQKTELAAGGTGLSAVARAMQLSEQEEGQSSSLYRDTTSSSRKGGAGMYASSTHNHKAGSNNTTSLKSTGEAQNRYAGSKSISSDQFFGRDEDHAQQMRGECFFVLCLNSVPLPFSWFNGVISCVCVLAKLGQYSNSTSISSDMMFGGESEESRQQRLRSGSGENLDALKNSVKDFFSDVQSRF